MKLFQAIAMVLIVAYAVRFEAQSVREPKFRIEIQTGGDKGPQFAVTNLSEKTLTAATIEFSVSAEARPEGKMNWDPLAQGGQGPNGEPQGPLGPGTSVTLYLPHRVGGS